MASYNKVILVGNLTRDPQLSYLPSQTAVCEIGLAVSRRYRTSDGQQREETCFIDCSAFGKQAETLNQYMSKGRQILIEGRLRYDTWETPEGQKRSKHRVMIDSFQFLDSGQARGAGSAPGAPQQRPAARPAARPASAQAPEAEDYAPPEDYPPQGGEDIPF